MDGRFTSFWQDVWCGETSLAFKFPRIYRHASHKNGLVVDHFIEGEWRPRVRRRNLREGEAIEMQEILSMLAPKRLCDGCDTWEWKWGKNKCFSVKSMYIVLMGGQGGQHPPLHSFPYKVVWKANVPLNLVWDALIGHLDRATTVLQPAEPRSILRAWPCSNTRGIGEDIWRVLPYSVLWVLWTAQNEIVFCQGTFDLRGIINRIKCMIWAWLDINSQIRNLKKDHQVTELLQGWELLIRDQW
ncbi:hypothetical protein FRX31_027691 [Thalictrum thalictroides]|uniref:Uncharacterized protein n=1 Tax=Thalictrum thalictroides TaxID=46969 RepID=A0A7J6VEG6_THATH|nr:hypothetical protein FRX31_027691 [Thalictrum thalictroides]